MRQLNQPSYRGPSVLDLPENIEERMLWSIVYQLQVQEFGMNYL